VGYGRHATHHDWPAARDSSRPPGERKDFVLVARIFFFREMNPLGPPVLRQDLSSGDHSIPKIFYFPRPFEILLGDVRLDGWLGVMDRRGLT
jgi:hypothetical protein